jgi:hypothetical protein
MTFDCSWKVVKRRTGRSQMRSAICPLQSGISASPRLA